MCKTIKLFTRTRTNDDYISVYSGANESVDRLMPVTLNARALLIGSRCISYDITNTDKHRRETREVKCVELIIMTNDFLV